MRNQVPVWVQEVDPSLLCRFLIKGGRPIIHPSSALSHSDAVCPGASGGFRFCMNETKLVQ